MYELVCKHMYVIMNGCFQASLVACDKCGRTFLPTRIEAHQRVCPQITKKQLTATKQVHTSDYVLYCTTHFVHDLL